MNSFPLTQKQIRYMTFIHDFIEMEDNFPSLSVLSEAFKVNANCCSDHLRALEKKGYIEKCFRIDKYRRTASFKTFMCIQSKNNESNAA